MSVGCLVLPAGTAVCVWHHTVRLKGSLTVKHKAIGIRKPGDIEFISEKVALVMLNELRFTGFLSASPSVSNVIRG